jgi:hypothetical protein
MKKILDFGYNAVAILLITAILLHFFGPIFALIIASAMFIYQFVPQGKMTSNIARNEVLRRIFSSDLQEVLFPDNAFYNGAQSDVAAFDALEIEIPQDEDGEAEVVVNPTQLPLPLGIESDKKLTYGADLLVTKPTVITYNNQLLTSYDKRAAKLRKHQRSLERQIAERILFGWAPTKPEYIIQTTGGTTRPASAPGATGTRKIATEAEFRKVAEMFDRLDIPDDGRRRILVPPGMKQDIWDIMKAYGQGTDFNNLLRGEGKVGKLFSFDIFMRSTTQRYTEAGVPVKKAIGAANVTTDNVAAIAFHLDFVRYIKGTVQVWMDPAPRGELAGGQSLNAGIRGGGTMSRLSEKGVFAIVEDN